MTLEGLRGQGRTASNPTGGHPLPRPRRHVVVVAHRVTGVLIFFFLFAHVLDTALVRVSPEAYNVVIETYKNPIVGVMEVGLVGAVLFHMFNGLRIMAVDFWEQGPRYQRQMLWGVVFFWVALMLPFVTRHLTHVFGG